MPAGTAPDNSIHRQALSLSRISRSRVETAAAATMPTAWNMKAPVTHRPRRARGMVSTTIDALMGYSAPTANPCQNRKKIRESGLQAIAHRSDVRTNRTTSS